MQFVVPSSTVLERRRLLSGDGSVSRTTSEQNNLDEPDWLRADVARAAANEWRPIKLLQLYAFALEQKPLLVKAVTSGFLGALRNLLAQCILWSEGEHAVWNDSQVSTFSEGRRRERGTGRKAKKYMFLQIQESEGRLNFCLL